MMAQVENSLSTASTLSYNSTNGNGNPSAVVEQETDQQQQQQPPPPAAKKKRNQPGMPDPEAEVVALSPKTLMATNRFVCEICGKGFQRDQNLQLHRRGHNLPWKLRQRGPKEAVKKRVYVCPETSCVHHDPRRALGDLTGIKKHFCRKHGEKKWKCDRCSKKYAVQSDWKAHLKTCGTREYKCDCGTIFSRRDSFVTHRAFCDALAQESAKVVQTLSIPSPPATTTTSSAVLSPVMSISHSSEMQENTIGATTSRSSAGCSTSSTSNCNGNGNGNIVVFDSSMFAPLSGLSVSPSISQPRSSFSSLVTNVPINSDHSNKPALSLSPLYQFSANAAPVQQQAPTMSATALLQKAAQMGAAAAGSSLLCGGFGLAVSSSSSPPEQVKPENGSPSPSRGAGDEQIGLGLPSGSGGSGLMMMGDPSGFFGSKPMTLDLLGLGIGPEGSSASAFPSYLTSMAGGPLDDATAFTAGSSSNSELKGSWDWDGQAAPEKA